MHKDRVLAQEGFLSAQEKCPLAFGLFRHLDESDNLATAPCVASELILTVNHQQVGKHEYRLDAGECYRTLLNGDNFVSRASNIAFRKSVWKRLGRFTRRYQVVWDYDFALRCTGLGDLGFIAKELQFHRVHSNSLSSRDHRVLLFRESIELKREHLNYPLFTAGVSELHTTLAEQYFGLAYHEARAGNLAKSLQAYLRAMSMVGGVARGVAGMAKAFPHKFCNSSRRPEYSACSLNGNRDDLRDRST